MARPMVPFPLAFDSARSVLAVKGHASVVGIHQTLKEARSLYAEAVKLQEAVLASHRDLKGYVALAETWHKSAESLLAQVETSRVRLKYLGRGFLALVFMIGTLAGLAGGFLALLVFRAAEAAAR